MKSEIGEIQPNCSEAVFRFYSEDPKIIREILQGFADEVALTTGEEVQQIPVFKKLKDYCTEAHEERDGNSRKQMKEMDEVNKKYGDDEAKRREEIGKVLDKYQKKKYPKGSLLYVCAGLGDNEVVVTHEPKLKAIRINIGNNDITGDIVRKIVKKYNLKAEEAEGEENNLQSFARDCTCGNHYSIENNPVNEKRKTK